MHVDAMNDDVGILKARLERRAGGNADQLFAGDRVHHQRGCRQIRNGHHLPAQAEAIEDVEDIGTELDAVADGAELRTAFEDARRQSATRQGKRRGEPAEPAADYENWVTC